MDTRCSLVDFEEKRNMTPIQRPQYKKYPKYRETGVEWLGEIPEHWKISKLKFITQINPEALSEDTHPNYIIQYIDISNVDEIMGIGNNQEMTFENAPSRARRIVRNGDTIVSTVRTYLKAVTHFEKAIKNQIVSTGFAVLRPKTIIFPKYLKWLVLSKGFIENIVLHSVGIGYPSINPSELASLVAWVPPISEQRAIANFLDRETARIDALIAKYQRLIELLEEKRISLISRAVTKGLLPNSELKRSYNRYIDLIPNRWTGISLKRLVETKITDGHHETPEFLDSGIPFVSAEEVQKDHINFDSKRGYISEKLHHRYSDKLHPKRNDIFMVKSGATTGKLAIVDTDIEFNVWSPLTLIRADNSKISTKYLFHALHAEYVQNQVKQLWTQGTQPNISMGEIENIFILVPPISEQHTIIDFLDREIAHIDSMKEKLKSMLTKLQEYRSALISAAVTGKIDVTK